MRRWALPFLFTLLLTLMMLGTAQAHSNLVRSVPSAGALLQIAPKELALEFSEAPDPSFSRVQLYTSKHQIVPVGSGTIDPTAARIMRLALPDLPKGSYIAVWRVRSAVDGHISAGSVPFGVGVAATPATLIPPPDAPDPATEAPPLLDTVARWLSYILAAVAFGALPFGLLVWRPALLAATSGAQRLITDQQATATDAALTRALRRLILIGAALFVLASLLFLVVQAASAADVPLAYALGAPALQLLRGRSGLLWVIRVALALVVMMVAWRLPPAGQGPERPWWLALSLAGAVLLTFSLNSHTVAAHQGAVGHAAHTAILLAWAHLAAMVIWLGGLLPLAIAIRMVRRAPDRALPLAMLIPHFSRVAIGSVIALTVSGIYSAFQQIGGLNQLAATTYGRALLIKIGLFVGLLLLGGLNRFVLAPRLPAFGNQLARMFGRSVRTELLLGALLLIAVGAMTSVAPSKIAWDAHEQLGLMQVAQEGDVDLVLRVAPAQIGDNEFAVDVTDKRPGAQQAPSRVLLRFDLFGTDLGVVQTAARQMDAQRYTARGSFTAIGGRWNVEVVLRRAGFDDVQHTFQLDILRSAAQTQ
jgi:copper transport protein